jgi:hypothetical protein
MNIQEVMLNLSSCCFVETGCGKKECLKISEWMKNFFGLFYFFVPFCVIFVSVLISCQI